RSRGGIENERAAYAVIFYDKAIGHVVAGGGGCHDKCSRRFCGSSQNCGRSHHQRQREPDDDHLLKSNRWEECARMRGKKSNRPPSTAVQVVDVTTSDRSAHLSCRKVGKTRIFTQVRNSSGESRLREVVPSI